jgi:hypothetical protein
MRKSGPGKSIDLLDVVEEFHKLEGSCANMLDFVGLLYGVEIVAHVVDAAAGRRHDAVEDCKVTHEQRFGVGCISIVTAIGHRPAAAGLVAGIFDVVANSSQGLECRDADLQKESVDVAGNKKPNAHLLLLSRDARLDGPDR